MTDIPDFFQNNTFSSQQRKLLIDALKFSNDFIANEVFGAPPLLWTQVAADQFNGIANEVFGVPPLLAAQTSPSDFDPIANDVFSFYPPIAAQVAPSQFDAIANDVFSALHPASRRLVSPLTTKGDLWAFAKDDIRFPVGTDRTILQSYDAAPDGSGLYWGDGFLLRTAAAVSGSAATTLTVDQINLDEDVIWFLWIKLKNATGSATSIRMYFNADSTATNYDRETLTGTGVTAAAANTNSPIFTVLPANSYITAAGFVFNDMQPAPRSLIMASEHTTTNMVIRLTSTVWRTTSTTPTQIVLSATAANSLDVGSAIAVYCGHGV